MQLVAFLSIGDSWYVRSRRSRCCEGSLVVSPEFQGRRLGREILDVELCIETELGYRAMINDFAASNQRMTRLLRRAYGRRQVCCCLSRFSLRPEYHASWRRGTVVERRTLTGELSLSCARPAADG